MSRSSNVIRPIPLRQSVGAMWEIIPPAPTQTTEAVEYVSWSNPGISGCRSSAPRIALPKTLIEVGEFIDARCMLFYPLSVDFDLNVLVQPYEADEPVPAKDGHYRHMAG